MLVEFSLGHGLRPPYELGTGCTGVRADSGGKLVICYDVRKPTKQQINGVAGNLCGLA